MRATILSLPGGRARRRALPGGLRQGPRGTRGLPRIRRPGRQAASKPSAARRSAASTWLGTAATLLVIGGLGALMEGPAWHKATALAAVNLALALAFSFTGLMLRREPGQRVAGAVLMLAGIFRCADVIDAWNGPWQAYEVVFGAADRFFGAWALLRYPNPSLSRLHRRYLAGLAAWMLVGRTLIAVTSTAQWNGAPPTCWWPALLPRQDAVRHPQLRRSRR